MANPTQVNIGIGLDMDALKKSVGLARGEISSLMRDIKREQSDVEKFNQKKRVLDEALRVGAITPQKHTQMLNAYRVEFNQLTQAEQQMAALMKRKAELQEYLNKLKQNSLEMELKSKEKERLDSEAVAAKKKADIAAYLERLKKNSLEMELKSKEKERLDNEAEAAKKKADIAAYLERLKKNSLEMELKSKEKERLDSEAAAAKKLADQQANLARIKKNSLEMELKAKDKSWNDEQSRIARARDSDRDRLRSLLDQVKTHKQIVAESDRFLERMKQQYNLSEKLLKKLKEIERLRIGGGDRGAGGGGVAGRLTGGLGQFGTGVMAGFGFAGITSVASQAGQALGDFIADSIKIAMERQRIEAAMEAMLGSERAAEKLTSSMRQLDKQSMLTFGEISKGAQTLLGFGVAQEMVMPSLDALSKISLGNAERFQSLSLAFGQVAASGKLAGQEILQMVNAGFNPLQEIARVTGRDMALLKADVEAGRVTFLQVAEAIITATEAGGRFEKINEKMLATPAGMVAKLKSDFEVMQAEFGEKLMPSLISLLDAIRDGTIIFSSATDAASDFFFGVAQGITVFEDLYHLIIRGTKEDRQNPMRRTGKLIHDHEQMMANLAKRRAEREAELKAKDEFNKLSPEERKKRLASEQAKRDEMKSDQDRMKMREETRKKLQKLNEDERQTYFREIGGLTAKTAEQKKLIKEAMDEYDQLTQRQARIDQSKEIQEEINRLQEEYNKLTMTEEQLLLRKLNLDRQNLSQMEQAEKRRLLQQRKQTEDEKNKQSLREFGQSFDKARAGSIQIANMITAVKNGFLDQTTASKEAMEIARGLIDDKVAMDNPRMMDLGQAKLAAQKMQKQLQNEQKAIEKLTELNAKAQTMINQNNNAPRLIAK
jgi:tape measure domain-containing protein